MPTARTTLSPLSLPLQMIGDAVGLPFQFPLSLRIVENILTQVSH